MQDRHMFENYTTVGRDEAGTLGRMLQPMSRKKERVIRPNNTESFSPATRWNSRLD